MRQEIRNAGAQAAIIPQTDPHQSEYLADHWQLRRWLSGFTGSAGSLVVTPSEALLWTDSRYFLQAAEQLEGTGIKLMKDGLPDTPSITSFLTRTLLKGENVAIDGTLFNIAETAALRETLAKHGIGLITDFSPADRLWSDRPALPADPVFIHDAAYAGEKASDKISRVLSQAAMQGASSIFISALDEIAWTLNIRSSDVPCNPVATAFLFLSPSSSTLFIKEEKITPEVRAHLEACNVAVAPYSSVYTFLAALPETARVLLEPQRNSGRILDTLGLRALPGTSPVALMKAVKNSVQIQGIRKSMERDGAALVAAFMEIESRMAGNITTDEVDIAEILTRHRSAQPDYFDDSFETIAGYGPHGAIVHYSATPESASVIEPRGLLLIDSGAQYLTGTTDITRTIAMGTPTPQERHDFTLVMKGHISLATAIFPEGTRGAQLDVLARRFLWNEGLTYLHGTGHGVGHFLNVHEGPQSIRLNDVPATLRPGMLTSNEPGLYRAGIHGIRCENLVLCVPATSSPEFGNFYRFETMTLFPFDRTLFDLAIMTPEEINWVNAYHQEVYTRLLPLLSPDQAAWLREKTLPL
ncbi:MAG: aminopeptidase P family protein [Muribaculaceae bacterium]|nr:aminopeptidase P family protein [Muribaculaceae bacterium]